MPQATDPICYQTFNDIISDWDFGDWDFGDWDFGDDNVGNAGDCDDEKLILQFGNIVDEDNDDNDSCFLWRWWE